MLTAKPGKFCGIYIATGPMWTVPFLDDNAKSLMRALEAVPTGPVVILGTGAVVQRKYGIHCPSSQPLTPLKTGHLPPKTPFNLALQAIGQRIRTFGGFIGVRGVCSQQAFNSTGLQLPEVEVLGCPSLFLNTRPHLGALLQRGYENLVRKLRDGAPVRVAIYWGYIRQNFMNPFLARFYIAHHSGSIHIMQWPYTEQDVFRKTVFSLTSNETIRAAAVNASIVFYDVRKWQAALRGVDLAVGPRIHGSMAALSVGTPAVTIAFDDRIHELCWSMKLACVSWRANQPPPHDDLAGMIEHAIKGFNGHIFDQNRRAIAARYVDLYQKSGLHLNPKVADLATGGD